MAGSLPGSYGSYGGRDPASRWESRREFGRNKNPGGHNLAGYLPRLEAGSKIPAAIILPIIAPEKKFPVAKILPKIHGKNHGKTFGYRKFLFLTRFKAGILAFMARRIQRKSNADKLIKNMSSRFANGPNKHTGLEI